MTVRGAQQNANAYPLNGRSEIRNRTLVLDQLSVAEAPRAATVNVADRVLMIHTGCTGSSFALQQPHIPHVG